MCLLVLSAAANAAAKSAPQPRRNPWVGAWGYAASPAVADPAPTRPAGTFQYRIRLTERGAGLALRFTDPENSLPLAIESVSVAQATADGPAGRKTPVAATFRGKRGTVVAAGASVSTDPIALPVIVGHDIVVTLVTSAPSTDVEGNAGFVTEFSANGITGKPERTRSRPFVSLVSVHNPHTPCTIVALGDSITEGARGKDRGWRGWPGKFARRMIETSPDGHCSVVNMGISGNRLLAYGRGPSGLDRFSRDVLAVPGVTHVVILEGINDIARSGAAGERAITAREITDGYREIVELAHAHGLKVIGGTMTPAWGARFNTADLERIRREANDWIRKPGHFDAVIDFEAALGDGSSPPSVRPDFDSGDKLHPNDAGYEAMADAVPVGLFETPLADSGAHRR